MPDQSVSSSPLRRERRRKPNFEETRETIKHVALELFLEKGFASTNVDEIAKKATVAKGTIFFHFKTKLNLLLEVFRSLSNLEEDFSELERHYKRGWTIEDVLKYVAKKTFEHGEKKEALRRLWMIEALRLKGKEGVFYRELVQKPVTPFEVFVTQRQDEGIFRDLDPYIVAMAFLGSLFSIRLWHEHLLGNKIRPISQETLVAQITDLFLNGLRDRGS